MLRQRSISAIFIVTAAVVPAVLGNPVLTIAIVALAAAGIVEFARATRSIDVDIKPVLPVSIGSALILATGFGASPPVVAGIATLGAIFLIIAGLIRGRISGSTRTFAFSVAAVVYISVPLAHVPLLRDHDGGEVAGWFEAIGSWSISNHPATGLGWMVLIVAVTWLTDTVAYLGGRAFGENKLAPVLSPGKTVEGAISGVIAGSMTGAAVVPLLGLPMPVYIGVGVGAVLSVVGQTGDLAESLIKRDLGVKDMGHVIPGHGGILDRIDALLFTFPVGYYLIRLALEVNWP